MNKNQKSSVLQKISNGSSNIQVAGDLTFNSIGLPVNTSTLIPCPECDFLLSSQAVECPACGFPVRDAFIAFVINQKSKTPNKIMKISFSIWALTFVLYLVFSEPIGSYFFFSGLPAAGVSALAAKIIENIRKNPQYYVSQEYETMFKRFLKAEKAFV